MRTDDLIATLTADHRVVDTTWLNRATVWTALFALAITVLLVLATLGPRRDFASQWLMGAVTVKVAYGACLAGLALVVFQRSLRPGLQPGRLLWLCLLPIGVAVGWAALTFSQAPVESWSGLTYGHYWRTCLIAAPAYALVPSVLLLALARRGAPVDRRLTGVSAGLASAGIAIIGYGLHCPDDTAPFMAAWYSIAIAIITPCSTIIAQRLLRW